MVTSRKTALDLVRGRFGCLGDLPKFRVRELQDRVRWSGMILELIGVVAVVWGLIEDQKTFNKEQVLRGIWDWLARVRYIVVPPPTLNITMELHEDQDTGFIFGGHDITLQKSTETFEERLSRLESYIKGIAHKLDEAIGKNKEVREKLEQERFERLDFDQSIRKSLHTKVTLEFGGVGFLTLGIFLANAPEGSANVLKCVVSLLY